jgi:sirohydrochlorin ferrochelatase
MSYLRTLHLRALLVPFLLTLAVLTSALAVEAKEPPSNACAMLPATQVAKVLQQPFGSPAKTTAPAATFDRVTGTDCTYRSGRGSQLLFRIYVDPTVAVAKETFTRLSAFYAPNRTVAGDWDSAYFDPQHIIHVQKGKERYALVLSPIGADAAQAEKQLKDLATWVAGQL